MHEQVVCECSSTAIICSFILCCLCSPTWLKYFIMYSVKTEWLLTPYSYVHPHCWTTYAVIGLKLNCQWLFYYSILGECTIRVTVLLEYLYCAFSICGCLLLYNSLIFNSILIYFGKSFFLWLVHLPSNL